MMTGIGLVLLMVGDMRLICTVKQIHEFKV